MGILRNLLDRRRARKDLNHRANTEYNRMPHGYVFTSHCESCGWTRYDAPRPHTTCPHCEGWCITTENWIGGDDADPPADR